MDQHYFESSKDKQNLILCKIHELDVTNHPAIEIHIIANDVVYFVDNETKKVIKRPE